MLYKISLSEQGFSKVAAKLQELGIQNLPLHIQAQKIDIQKDTFRRILQKDSDTQTVKRASIELLFDKLKLSLEEADLETGSGEEKQEENPFTMLGKIESTDAFFGREKELRQMRNFMRQAGCQLIGGSSIGKSSLLWHSYNTTPQTLPDHKIVTSFLDGYFAPNRSLAGFVRRVISDFTRCENKNNEDEKNKAKKNEKEGGKNEDGKKEDGKEFASTLHAAGESLSDFNRYIEPLLEQNIRPVLYIDNFHVFLERMNKSEFNNDFWDNLRSLNDRGMSLLVSSDKRLSELFKQAPGEQPSILTSQFWASLPPIHLEGFSRAEAMDFIRKRRAGIQAFTREDEEEILQAAQSFSAASSVSSVSPISASPASTEPLTYPPQHLQILCYYVLEARYARKGIDAAIKEAREQIGI